jgi:hypothetical protein
VIRGTVKSVRQSTVRSADFWMLPQGSPSIDDPVAYVTLRVGETLRGAHPGPEWTFMVYNCDYATAAYPVGREMIICAFYHPRLKTYYHTASSSRYLWTGNAWAGDSTVSDAALRHEIADVDIATVVKDATLIMDGTIESVDTSVVLGPDSSSAELISLGFRVDRIRKGKFAEPTDSCRGNHERPVFSRVAKRRAAKVQCRATLDWYAETE